MTKSEHVRENIEFGFGFFFSVSKMKGEWPVYVCDNNGITVKFGTINEH